MNRSLLLNADWSPLNFISDVRALKLVMRGRAEIVAWTDGPSVWSEKMKSPTKEFVVPATIRLLCRVNRKRNTPRFRKKVLFNRDGWQCQYCSTPLDWGTVTIDHVKPRCRGGATSWKNCVASCKRCNAKKGPKLPAEAGMKLIKQPSDPKVMHYYDFRQTMTSWHPDWNSFLTI